MDGTSTEKESQATATMETIMREIVRDAHYRSELIDSSISSQDTPDLKGVHRARVSDRGANAVRQSDMSISYALVSESRCVRVIGMALDIAVIVFAWRRFASPS